MNFKSLEFLIFFPIAALVFFRLPHRFRWIWLLVASLFFYSRWRAIYVPLILGHALIDYTLALAIDAAPTLRRRRAYLAMSLCTGIGLLVYFKYTGFFLRSAAELAQLLGHHVATPTFAVALPLGISFYTFVSMSYTIDVYRKVARPERHLGYFLAFIAYFPTMVAGPIERASRLLPQLRKEQAWDEVRFWSGIRLMAWGFFKKIAIADRLAMKVDLVFGDAAHANGAELLLAVYFFAFQIYCDFSGYSDIAIGAARVMGHDIDRNFDRPFFSRSPTEFWRRWHISLATWLRDYVYISLGAFRFSRNGLMQACVQILITFTISGLWHGANWTFVIWGALNGLYLVADAVKSRLRLARKLRFARYPRVAAAGSVFVTFNLIVLSFVFFRAASVREALADLCKIVHLNGAQLIALVRGPRTTAYIDAGSRLALSATFLGVALIALLVFIEHVQGRVGKPVEELLTLRPRSIRWPAYAAVLVGLFVFGSFFQNDFIYFHF